MSIFISCITYATVAVLFLIKVTYVEAQDYDDEDEYPINAPCYKLFGYWFKRLARLAQECYNERRPKAQYMGDPKHVFFVENSNCTARCIVIKLGLIKEDGKLDVDEIVSFADEYLPERLEGFVTDVLNECLHLGDGLQNEDEKCSQFGQIVSCASRRVPVLFKLCYPGSKPGFPMRPYPSKSG